MLKKPIESDHSTEERYGLIKGRLSVQGWTARIFLFLWQIVMLFCLFKATSTVDTMLQELGNSFGLLWNLQSLGADAALLLTWMVVFFFWVGGTVMFGIWALLTVPPNTIVLMNQAIVKNEEHEFSNPGH